MRCDVIDGNTSIRTGDKTMMKSVEIRSLACAYSCKNGYVNIG